MAATAPPRDHPEHGPNPLRERFGKVFTSARLTYRSVEKTEDADLITRMKQDPVAIMNDNPGWPRPHTRKDTERLLEMMENNLISVVMESKGEPVGLLCLWPSFNDGQTPNRVADFSIDVLPDHRGQGYGEEGLCWLMDWAFDMAGLHRVRLDVFGWNTSAIRLYERVGFERVGVERESLWSSGQWWDLVVMGLLARDWREIRARKANVAHRQ